jgi:hypothetical protein
MHVFTPILEKHLRAHQEIWTLASSSQLTYYSNLLGSRVYVCSSHVHVCVKVCVCMCYSHLHSVCMLEACSEWNQHEMFLLLCTHACNSHTDAWSNAGGSRARVSRSRILQLRAQQGCNSSTEWRCTRKLWVPTLALHRPARRGRLSCTTLMQDSLLHQGRLSCSRRPTLRPRQVRLRKGVSACVRVRLYL